MAILTSTPFGTETLNSTRYHNWYNSSNPDSTTEYGYLTAKDGSTGRTVITSGKTPGFHELLREGKLVPFTELHVKETKQRNLPSYCQSMARSGDYPEGAYVERVMNGDPVAGVKSCSAVSNRPTEESYDPLLLKALGEAKSGALLILLELAEGRKTVELFRGFNRRLGGRVQKIRQAARSYKPKSAKAFHEVFADLWLEYRYGWRQLYFTAQDITRSLEIMSKEKTFVVNTGKAKKVLSNPMVGPTYGIDVSSYPGLWETVSQNQTSTLEQRAVVSLQISKAQAALDFNPIALAWELIPYSFVVDWFVNIGDIARAVWPVPYIAKSAATSVKYTDKAELYIRARTGTAHEYFMCSVGEYILQQEEYHRTPYNGDIPLVVDFDARLGLNRLLDVVALAKDGLYRHRAKPWKV